jgi:hypothetical protein
MHVTKMKSLFLFISISLLAGCPYQSYMAGHPDAEPRITVVNTLSESLAWLDHDVTPDNGDLLSQGELTGAASNQVLASGDHYYVVNSQSNSITQYDRETLTRTGEFSTGAGTNPYNAVISGDTIHCTAYLSHQVLSFSLVSGLQTATFSLENFVDSSTTWYPYPQGIVQHGNLLFAGCLNSTINGASGSYSIGRVAVCNTSSGLVIGYIETGAANSSSLLVHDGYLYILSAGTFSSGYQENGIIERIQLSGADFSTTSNRVFTNLTLEQVTDGHSFGRLALNGSYGWSGNLGNGVLVRFDTSVIPWQVKKTRTLPGSYGFANISDIDFDQTRDQLFVLEFNGNRLYCLDPVSLDTTWYARCSTGNLGDPVDFYLKKS